MIVRTSTAILFRDITLTSEFLQCLKGQPVIYKGQEIGTILNADYAHITMEISEDSVKDEFTKSSSFEIVGG